MVGSKIGVGVVWGMGDVNQNRRQTTGRVDPAELGQRPILEYGSSIWNPHPDKLQEELEKVQNRASRFATRNYVYETGSMTGILGQLKLGIP